MSRPDHIDGIAQTAPWQAPASDALFSSENTTVFLHLPKTGGTSVTSFLLSRMTLHERMFPERFSGLWRYSDAYKRRFHFFSGHYDWTDVTAVTHRKHVFTVLRDPRDRVLSLYYYWRSRGWDEIEARNLSRPRLAKSLSLLDFLRSDNPDIRIRIDNVATRSLIGGRFAGPQGECLMLQEEALAVARQRLLDMSFFGLLEDMHTTFRVLCAMLNIGPADRIPHEMSHRVRDGETREQITPAIRAELERLTSADRALYDFAKEEFANRHPSWIQSHR